MKKLSSVPRQEGTPQQYCSSTFKLCSLTRQARLPHVCTAHPRQVHALSAGLKAYTTTFTQEALSTCREACGGHGYAAVNRLGALRSDHDIFQTFEGDNTVLMQQVGGVKCCCDMFGLLLQ